MATIPVPLPDRELRAHEDSFTVFRRIVFFAAMHIGFTLVCLALAALADEPVFAVILWICGTLGMLGTYIVRTTDG